MKLLINALSSTQLSGKNVLLGHLRELLRQAGEHRYVVLHNAANRDAVDTLGDTVGRIEAPEKTTHWFHRRLWEQGQIPRLLVEEQADVLFMFSGTVLKSCPRPQATLALNPWCMVPEGQSGAGERLKAALQRHAYRQAVQHADLLFYASGFLQQLYETNAGRPARRSRIAYCGLNQDILDAAPEVEARVTRSPKRILCVSRMMPYKRIETVVEALGLLRREHGQEAELRLVGGWADPAYRARIEAQAEQLGVRGQVVFAGHVSREQLFEEYARARVFCLLSACESFGIPSIEAQHFGTPSVCADACAMPEVCGSGGTYAPPGDAAGAAEALRNMLCDEEHWQAYSDAARINARRFLYEETVKPLFDLFTLEDPHGA